MVSTIITFSKADVQAPVFVAGAFTDWAPVEMNCETIEEDGSVRNHFSYKASLEPGEYQYKFRLGPGDWWTLDESKPTASDGAGNVNNVLNVELQKTVVDVQEPAVELQKPVVEVQEPVVELQEPVTPERVAEPRVRVLNTDDAYIMEEESDEPPMKEITASNETSQENLPAEETPIPVVMDLRPQAPIKAVIGEDSLKVEGLDAMSIPEIAPPPYSYEETSVGPAPLMGAAGFEKQPGQHGVVQARPEVKKEQSWISRMCGGNVWLVAAIVAVPIAIGLYRSR